MIKKLLCFLAILLSFCNFAFASPAMVYVELKPMAESSIMDEAWQNEIYSMIATELQKNNIFCKNEKGAWMEFILTKCNKPGEYVPYNLDLEKDFNQYKKEHFNRALVFEFHDYRKNKEEDKTNVFVVLKVVDLAKGNSLLRTYTDSHTNVKETNPMKELKDIIPSLIERYNKMKISV